MGNAAIDLFRLPVYPFTLGVCRVAGCRFGVPCGRPGPVRAGFGALAGTGSVWRMQRNPRRTQARVSRLPGPAGLLCSRAGESSDQGTLSPAARKVRGLAQVGYLVGSEVYFRPEGTVQVKVPSGF